MRPEEHVPYDGSELPGMPLLAVAGAKHVPGCAYRHSWQCQGRHGEIGPSETHMYTWHDFIGSAVRTYRFINVDNVEDAVAHLAEQKVEEPHAFHSICTVTQGSHAPYLYAPAIQLINAHSLHLGQGHGHAGP